jgi:hypothetical protein
VHKAYCLSNLVLRNREAPLPLLLEMQEAGMAVPNPLALPFMLIKVGSAPASAALYTSLFALLLPQMPLSLLPQPCLLLPPQCSGVRAPAALSHVCVLPW